MFQTFFESISLMKKYPFDYIKFIHGACPAFYKLFKNRQIIILELGLVKKEHALSRFELMECCFRV